MILLIIWILVNVTFKCFALLYYYVLCFHVLKFLVDLDLHFYYRNLLVKLLSIFQLNFHFSYSYCDYVLLLCTLITWL